MLHFAALLSIIQLLRSKIDMTKRPKLEYRFTVNLSKETSEKIQDISLKEGLPTALVIRQAVEEYLMKKQETSNNE